MVQVKHRDGRVSEYSASLTLDMIDKVIQGLEVDKNELIEKMQVRFDEGITLTTRKIQEGLINASHELATINAPDWILVAGRLKLLDWNKEVEVARSWGYGEYLRSVTYLMDKEVYGGAASKLNTYTPDELEEAGKWIDPDRDMRYTIAGATQLIGSYLCKDELLQEMFLTQALILAYNETNRLDIAHKYYEYLSLGYISLATPVLRNLRRPGGSLTSCFLLDIDDSIEGIFHDGLYNIARMSKNGGGVGVRISRIRAENAPVGKINGVSKGVMPWISLIDSTAVNVDQGGTRRGAVTVGLDVWHHDLIKFLDMKSEVGDRNNKAYNIFPQVIVTDEFCRRAEANMNWYLICPHEVKTKLNIDIVNLWGSEFDEAYGIIEDTILNTKKLKLVKEVNARDILKKLFQLQEESGTPYIAFKDTINRTNPDKHDGTITHVNLCVAPNTHILTNSGYQVISELEDKQVKVWNGQEWSEVTVRKTGVNQPLLRVELSSGAYIDCTYYHKFHLSNGKIVTAEELVPGDVLVELKLPALVEGDDNETYEHAYTAGYYAASKHIAEHEVEIDNVLLPYINKKYVYEHWKPGHSLVKVPPDISTVVPLNNYDIYSRLDWLAGVIDAAGRVVSHRICVSAPYELLLSIRLLLQTLGVNSYIHQKECIYFYPGSLYTLGLLTGKVKWKWNKQWTNPVKTDAIAITKVDSIGSDDTYCFTEPKRNLGTFNGHLIGNCVESYSNTAVGTGTTRQDKDNTVFHHSCNLVSLNQAVIPDDMLPDVCRSAVRILDNTIDLTTPPTEGSRNHNAKYRTIGVGSMGLADWLAKNEIRLVDEQQLTPEASSAINRLYEDIGYYTTLASCELAEERGAYPAFNGSEWSKGLLMGGRSLNWISQYSYDYPRWVELSERIKVSGIRNSHIQAIAPNTSSSLIQGVTASILPTYSKFYTEKIGRGLMKVAPPFLQEKFWYYRENKYIHPSVIIDMTSIIQRWLTTGISMELLYNLAPNAYKEGSTITSYDYYLNFLKAWKSDIKTMYYIRSIPPDQDYTTTNSCTTCAN